MKSCGLPTLIVVGLLSSCTWAYAARATDESDPALQWFYDDSDLDSLDVNEGELEFLPPRSVENLLHSSSSLIISRHSLDTGWVRMEQCYSGLDPVPRTDIVFHYRKMTGLEISSLHNISRAGIDNQTIELEGVGESAQLCIRAQVQNLVRVADGRYVLSSGPYHRKFLDGYYPFHVTLDIRYPDKLIQLDSLTPEQRPGFEVITHGNQIMIDTWFEGRLTVEIRFSSRQ